MKDDSSPILERALDYARRGWPVLPCTPRGGKSPYPPADLDKDGKKIPRTGGLYKATTDETQIRAWWRRWPDALIGIRMGEASGAFAVDPDVVKKAGDKDGMAAWTALVAEHGGVPETYSHRTPSGGKHILFRWRADRPLTNGRGSLPAGVDVRGQGGYIIAPPSRLADGRSYAADGVPLDLAAIADPPDWLLKVFLATAEKKRAAGSSTARGVAGPARQRTRDDRRANAYAETALRAEVAAVRGALRGQRNDQLNRSAFNLGQLVGSGLLEEAYVERELLAAAAGLSADDGEDRSYATLRSGLSAGMEYPRDLPSGDEPNADDLGPVEEAHAADEEDDCGLKWHGDRDDAPLKEWLVDVTLPKVGVALASGQWGVYKTFVVLDLCGCVITGAPFAGRDVIRRGGVLFMASEGQDEVRLRLAGLVNEKIRRANCEDIDPDRVPFAWHEECPKLTDADALSMLRKIVGKAAASMKERYGLELAMMAIDTLMASADFKDANDAAEAQRVFRLLGTLGREFSILVLVVDHFGKDVSTGTRNSSAKEGAADAVLALLGERDLAGKVSNPRMAIRKVRGAPTGAEIPYTPRVVEVFDGTMIRTTLVMDWNRQEQQAGASTPADRKWPTSLKIFKAALSEALGAHGAKRRPFGDNLEVRCVDREKVREEFMRRYPADNPKAKREAFSRCEKDAVARGVMGSRDVGPEGLQTVFWLIERDGKD